MNEGKYIFAQVMSLVPRQIFQRLVDKYKGDYRVRDFNCSNQLRYMMFGQVLPAPYIGVGVSWNFLQF